MRWYEQMFENVRLMDALWNSLVVGVISSIIATALGFLAAYGLARHRIRYGGGIQWILMTPITVSYLIIGVGLLITFKSFGMQISRWRPR